MAPYEDLILRARRLYRSEAIEFCDEPLVCPLNDGGVMVQAWVWVPSCEEETHL